MELNKKFFIATVATISEQLYRVDGDLHLCVEVLDYLGDDAREHFNTTMETSYWPDMATISGQLDFDGKFESLAQSEIGALKLETRLKCLNEWKELVLKDEIYKEF